MPKGPFLPSDFTATKFSTAADEAEFGNTLLRFIESEWAPALFTKSFYNRLSICFAHIAHYNRTQFYEEWFSSLAARVRFLKHTLRFPGYGDPGYTFSDVERAIQREIVNRNYLARYELRLVEEQQATDLALLRQLESKYRTPVGERDQEPQLDVQPVNPTPITPIKARCSEAMQSRNREPSGSFDRISVWRYKPFKTAEERTRQVFPTIAGGQRWKPLNRRPESPVEKIRNHPPRPVLMIKAIVVKPAVAREELGCDRSRRDQALSIG